MVVAREVFALTETLHRLALPLVEGLGDEDAHLDDEVARAVAIALDGRQTFAAEAERLARLRARFDLDLHARSVDGRYVHLASERGRGDVEQEIIDHVLAVAHEGVVGLLLDIDLDVARDAVVLAHVALARDVDDHALGHTREDVDLDDLLALDDTRSVTLLALVLDDLALAATDVASGLGLHHAEDALLGADLHAAAVAVGTGLGSAAALGARAVAMGADHVLAELELLGHARGHLLERQAHLQPQVRSTIARGLASATTASEASEAAMAAEDVAKHGEDVVHREAARAAKRTAASEAARGVEAKLVVLLALLRVVEHVVGLGGLLEFLLGRRVARVAVGVILDGELAVGLLDVGLRGVLGEAQYLVVVSLCCHIVAILLSYGHLGVADHFVVERIARLHAVDDLALLVVAGRHHGDGLVEIDVEVLVLGVDGAHAKALEDLLQFLHDELEALAHGRGILALVGQGALEVVKHGQQGRNRLLATIEDQLGLLLHGALLVVVKLGEETDVLVLPLHGLGLRLLLGSELGLVGLLSRFGLFGLFSLSAFLSAILRAFGHTHVFCLVVAGLGGLALYLYVLLFTHFVLSFFKKTHSKYCAKAGAPALLAGRVCASGCEVHPGARRVSCSCLYMSA